jgi:hypothetical protein
LQTRSLLTHRLDKGDLGTLKGWGRGIGKITRFEYSIYVCIVSKINKYWIKYFIPSLVSSSGTGLIETPI